MFEVVDTHRSVNSTLRLDGSLLREYLTGLDPRALKEDGDLTEDERWGLFAVYMSEIVDKDFGPGIVLREWGLARNAVGTVDWFVRTG